MSKEHKLKIVNAYPVSVCFSLKRIENWRLDQIFSWPKRKEESLTYSNLRVCDVREKVVDEVKAIKDNMPYLLPLCS